MLLMMIWMLQANEDNYVLKGALHATLSKLEATREELHATRSKLSVTQEQAQLLLAEREAICFLQAADCCDRGDKEERSLTNDVALPAPGCSLDQDAETACMPQRHEGSEDAGTFGSLPRSTALEKVRGVSLAAEQGGGPPEMSLLSLVMRDLSDDDGRDQGGQMILPYALAVS